MKNRIFKSILVLVMAFFAIPIFAQDAVVVFFKDGNFRKFYLKDIVEISTSQYDEYGTAHSDYQYQHIITKSEKFVYDLSNINSIGFSKYDDAKAEQNFVEAMPKVANALSDCETISDAESQIDQIKEQQGVEDAWSDGHQLYVKIEEGETFSFHFDHSVEIDGDWMESGDYQNFAKAMASKVKRANASVNSQVKVVVANQQHYDESRVSHTTDFLEPLLQAFRDCGFVADYVKDPTVDFFYDNSSDPNNLHIYDYDIILLVTHGAYLEPKYLATKGGFWRDFHEEVANYDLKCHAIMTSEVIDNLPIKGAYDDKWKECYAKFKAWRDESQFQNVSDIDLSFEFMKEERGGENRWIAHPVLTEYFFRHIATGRFHDNSILFNTACQSLLSDGGPEIPSCSFANEFFDKNLSLYAGYTEENFLGTDVMAMFLSKMLNYGLSIGYVDDDLPKAFKKESIENIKNSSFLTDKTRQKIYDDGGPKDAELLILPYGNIETRLRFLFGVYTNEKDQSSVTQEFNTDKAVTISSTLTANKPKYINAGFYYGTDVNNLSENVEASFKRNIDNQGKGNCEFVATLTNLEPGKTYHYRAYTFDGMNYNYGEPCSFTIEAAPAYPDLQLSQTLLSIIKGGSATVEITAGSGEYGVTNLNSSIARGTLQGTTVTIDGVAVGNDAKIVVTDMQTGQQIIITVSVTGGGDVPAYTSCPDSHHPHLIDLGLPSGTKWACCNVGASKPEEYGGYFSWGETTEKSSYTDDNYLDGKGTSYDIGKNITGTQYDAATANWGSPWVMPNKDQMNELEDECTSEWITKNGVNGCRFTGPNGASIFLPAGGGYFGDDLSSAGSIGVYWSSSLNESQTGKAWYLYFNSGSEDTFYSLRSCGLSVRPVMSDAAPYYPDLQLSETQISIVKGSSNTVEITSGSGEYGVTNLNSSIAKATLQGTTITISALSEGNAKVVVTDMQSGQKIIIEVTVTANSTPEGNAPEGVEAVDLGLPSGTLWASWNLGATKPEESGDYYAWSETNVKEIYDLNTYQNWKDANGDGRLQPGELSSPSIIAGTKYDAATVNWGAEWYTPTYKQVDELLNNTTSEWVTENGVDGRRFTSNTNGNSIFLPVTGSRAGSSLNNTNLGTYWSSTEKNADYSGANYLVFGDSDAYCSADWPYRGHIIRPVKGSSLPDYSKERDELIKLYNSTNGDSWTHNDNWCSSKSPAQWYGITYDKYNEHVEYIKLANNNLTGSISIKGFEELRNIDIKGNNISSLTIDSCPTLHLGYGFSLDDITLDFLQINNCLYDMGQHLMRNANIKKILFTNFQKCGRIFLNGIVSDEVVIKDCVFDGEGVQAEDNSAVKTMTVENSTIESGRLGGDVDDLVIKNCTIGDWWVISAKSSITIINSSLVSR